MEKRSWYLKSCGFQGREAAAHEDLKDEAQTVKITKLPVQKDTEQPQKTDTTATAPVKTGV